MDKPFFRSNIPLRSTLTVLVSGGEDDEEEAFTAEGALDLPDGEVSWTNRQLKAGVSLELDDPGSYSGRIDLTFARKSTARLQMTVAKPDASKFVYDQSLTQSSGLDRTHVLLVTRKK